jgi:uncharacterized protein YjdB
MRALNSLGLTLFATTLVLACDSPSGPGGQIAETAVLTIEPGNAILQGGASVKLTATIKDQNGLATFPVGVSWLSSNQAVAAVREGGFVQGLRAGQTEIVATWRNARGIARVTVTDRPNKPDTPTCPNLTADEREDLTIPKGDGKC